MAFTLAHPAIILPLKRYADKGYLVLPALIVGSMMPDIGYLIPGRQSQIYTHTITGALITGIPTGLLMLWLFDRWLKKPLSTLLPQQCSQQFSMLPPIHFWPLSRLSSIIFSVIVGIFTHLIWDGFTHGQGWAVQAIPLLQEPLFTFFDLKVKTYYLIKHGSSTLGLTVVAYWVWQQLQPAKNQNTILELGVKVVLILSILSLGIFAGLMSYVINYNQIKSFIGISLILISSSIIVAALVQWVRVRPPPI